MGVFVFFVGVVGGGWGRGRFQRLGGFISGFLFFLWVWWVGGGEGEGSSGGGGWEGSPWGGASGEEIALGRDREGFLANDDGDGERRTATLRRRR